MKYMILTILMTFVVSVNAQNAQQILSEIQKEFNLPGQHCFPLISLCLGYQKSDPAFRKGRFLPGDQNLKYSEL